MTSQPLISVSKAVSPFYLGIDVGGTGIKIGVVDDEGKTLGFDAIPTEEPRGPTDAMQRVSASASALLASLGLSCKNIVRVGLGTPGSQANADRQGQSDKRLIRQKSRLILTL